MPSVRKPCAGRVVQRLRECFPRMSSDNTSPWILGSVLSHLKPLRDHFGDWRAVEINFRAVGKPT
jgi:hypothetical protein